MRGTSRWPSARATRRRRLEASSRRLRRDHRERDRRAHGGAARGHQQARGSARRTCWASPRNGRVRWGTGCRSPESTVIERTDRRSRLVAHPASASGQGIPREGWTLRLRSRREFAEGFEPCIHRRDSCRHSRRVYALPRTPVHVARLNDDLMLATGVEQREDAVAEHRAGDPASISERVHPAPADRAPPASGTDRLRPAGRPCNARSCLAADC